MRQNFLHVGIIPDGNRRWARSKNLRDYEGHKAAGNFNKVESFVKESRDLGIKYLTIWGFSTENWKRSKKERENLFKVFENLFDSLSKISKKYSIRLRCFGRRDRLPKHLIKKIEFAEKETEKNSEIGVNVCLDYGGRDEIVRSVNKILKSGKKKISESDFQKSLDSSEIPDLDLIIRTSGEKRLSGFMPFQGVYAELYFTKKYFPDFTPRDLRKAVNDFLKRNRRFGGN